jgi:hypothetical protein
MLGLSLSIEPFDIKSAGKGWTHYTRYFETKRMFIRMSTRDNDIRQRMIRDYARLGFPIKQAEAFLDTLCPRPMYISLWGAK